MRKQLEQDFLLGNEAIARGAIEANIDYVTGYPGTPSTEVLETLARDAQKHGIRVEWATNEMVAFENALGVSLAGLRAMVTMKHAGLNWVTDPLSVAVLSGVRGGLVILTADDPNCHSSANEQDNRFYGLFFKILTLEPSDPQEAKDMTIEAFSLSEKTELPVILRSVTRVGHARTNVVLGKIPPRNRQAHFEKDPDRFFMLGRRALPRHRWLLQQQLLLESLAEGLRFNRFHRNGGEKKLIVTSGVAYTYVRDALRMLKTSELSTLKIATPYPLPKYLIKEALWGKEVVLVVEEGGPFVELQLKALVQDLGIPINILGKMSGDVPTAGELNADIVAQVIAKLLGKDAPKIILRQDVWQKAQKLLSPRTMVFCAGCPHTGTMYALKKVMNKRTVLPFVSGDIGCYTIMSNPPHELGDVKYSMGASIGIASGMSEALIEKTIAVIGDSTFIHAGIPGLINCLYNHKNILVVVVDNRTTAMTGGQPHAGTGVTATNQRTKMVDLEQLIKGCGTEFVEVTDPYDINRTKEVLERALNYEGVSVVISQRECALQVARETLRLGKKLPSYKVDEESCIAGELPFCQAACPLHVDVKKYIALFRKGKYDEALSLIRDKLPFPGIIGRICTRPCERDCKRGEVDEPLAINAIKRAVFDYAKNKVREDFNFPEEIGKRVAIVGGGPAGLIAAHDLRMMGYHVTIFEALPVLGGMLSVGIPEYRLPRDILQTDLSIMQKLGIEIKLNTKVGTDVRLSELKRDFNAVFLAIGAHKGRRLAIENEENDGVVDGVEFLHQLSLGKKAEVKDTVVIVGGGNVAIDCARVCLRLGFKKVIILYRRSREEMPAIREEVEKAEEEGVTINFLATPIRVLVESGLVKGIECIRTKLGKPDSSGRRRPIPIEGSEFITEIDIIISAIGEQPDLSLLDGKELTLSVKDGLLETNPVTLETSIPWIFAGGDAVTGPASVIDALAAGRKAAVSIDRYIRGKDIIADREGEGPQKSNLLVNIEGTSKKHRQQQVILPLEERRANFKEVEQGFGEEETIEEAERCLSCECWECLKSLACPAMVRDGDKVIIDSSLCPGCEICVQVCPADAIVLTAT